MVNNKYYEDKELWLVNRVREGTSIFIISDGSFHLELKKGGVAWLILASNDQSYYIIGDNLYPEPKEAQCSY